jgi:hypothetical protein
VNERTPPLPDKVARAVDDAWALDVVASKVRADIVAYERELANAPFWRFRRRQAAAKALADARREERALRYLGKAQ